MIEVWLKGSTLDRDEQRSKDGEEHKIHNSTLSTCAKQANKNEEGLESNSRVL